MNDLQSTQLKFASCTINEPRTVIYKTIQSRLNNYRGRAKRYRVEDSLMFDELLGLFNGSLWCCVYCGCQLTLSVSSDDGATFDHIIPMSRGGGNDIANVVPCCRGCNNSKENREMLTWLDESGFDLEDFAQRYGSMWIILNSRCTGE